MSLVFDKYYTLKLWILTIIFGPLLLPIYYALDLYQNDVSIDSNFYEFCFLSFIFSIFYSFPSLIVTFFISVILRGRKHINKIFITIFSIIPMLTSIYIIFGKEIYTENRNYLGIVYSVITASIIFSSFVLSKIT